MISSSHLSTTNAKFYLISLPVRKQKIKVAKFNGTGKNSFFGKINLVKEFPSIPNIANIQELWEEFKNLHKLLQNENILNLTARKFIYQNLSNQTCHSIHPYTS